MTSNLLIGPIELINLEDNQKRIWNYKQSIEIAASTNTSSKEETNEADGQIICLEEFDNPLREILSKQFLQTSIIASCNLLEDFSQLNNNKVNLVIQNSKLNELSHPKSINQLDQKINKLNQGLTDLNIKQQLNSIKKNRDSDGYRPIQINIENFVKIRKQPVTQYYQFGEIIGEGSFGYVYAGKCLSSGEDRAIKILKMKRMDNSKTQQFLSEMELLRKLDHPNIIKLYQLFYHDNYYYVITELCKGGSLLNFIRKNRITSQVKIATIMKQLLSAVSYLHYKGIAHRDLKLENIVFLNNYEKDEDLDYSIKIIDFGLAITVSKYPQKIKQIAGTLNYLSPQSLDKILIDKCDVWSCGVIFYILLIDKSPFAGNSKENTIENIKKKQIIFQQFQWRMVSEQAKSLLALMLEKKFNKRITAEGAFRHQWINIETRKNMLVSKIKSSQKVCQQLSCYNRGNNLVAVVQSYLSFRKVTQEERTQMYNLFQSIDKDGSGMIDINQLKEVYQGATNNNNKDIQQILAKADRNKSGLIDFSEFLVAVYNRKKLFQAQSLSQAFDHYDIDKNGYLSKKQLKQLLKGCQNQQIKYLLSELDKDKDNKVSREEFIHYLLEY